MKRRANAQNKIENKVQSGPAISAFFPAYNEAGNIQRTIAAAEGILGKLTSDYEIIVVNDASKDNTAELVGQEMKRNPKIRLVTHPQNIGYGGALKTGIANSRHDFIFFSDADMQFDLNELDKFVGYVSQYDAIIGFRKDRQDHIGRIINAKLWNIVNRVLFGLKVTDIDCAFKLLRREHLQKITLNCDGQAISAEMLIKLKSGGAKFIELPVTHFPRKHGSPTGAKVGVIMKALRELWQLYSEEMGDRIQIQFIKFVNVGLVNTLTSFVIYTGLTRLLSMGYVWAGALSYIGGTITGFLLNRIWTFQKREGVQIREIVRFYVIALTSLLINVSAIYFLVNFAGLYDILAFILAAGLTVAWNFFFSKYWVFAKPAIWN